MDVRTYGKGWDQEKGFIGVFFFTRSLLHLYLRIGGEKKQKGKARAKKKEMGKRKSFIHISGVFGFFIQLGVFISML